MKARVILKGLVLLLSLAIVGYLFGTSHLGNSVNEAWIDAQVRGHGLHGAILFLVTGGLLTAIGLPRQIIAFLGGYAFSVALGTLLGGLATLLGCALSFGYARCLARDLLRVRLGERAKRVSRFMHDHPFAMTVLLRLLPVGNNLLTNLTAGVSEIRAGPFFAGSLVGYLPQTLAFALVGAGIHVRPGATLVLAIVLFVCSGALGAHLYQRFRQGHLLDETADSGLDESCHRISHEAMPGP